jgi:hypothetical protein
MGGNVGCLVALLLPPRRAGVVLLWEVLMVFVIINGRFWGEVEFAALGPVVEPVELLATKELLIGLRAGGSPAGLSLANTVVVVRGGVCGGDAGNGTCCGFTSS